MKSQNIKAAVKNFTQNKVYQFLTSFILSVAIAYVSWNYLIEKVYTKRVTTQGNIKGIDLNTTRIEIENLQKDLEIKREEYILQEVKFKEIEPKIYQTHYPVITDILDKVNVYSFNIQDYKLSSDMKRMDVSIEGSFQNFIRFIDFLGAIPATVIVKDYAIKLSDDKMMVIKLGIEVEPIKI